MQESELVEDVHPEEEKEVDEKNTQVYEVAYHLVPTLSEEELPAAIGKVRAAIEKNAGVIISEGFPAKITLAYPLPHILLGKRNWYTTTSFGWLKFEMLSDEVKTLHTTLKSNTDVPRFLILKTVREDTMMPKRTFIPREAVPKTESEKPIMSEEELDKTIEKLVV